MAEQYETFGKEWEKEINKIPKSMIIKMLADKGKENELLKEALEFWLTTFGQQPNNIARIKCTNGGGRVFTPYNQIKKTLESLNKPAHFIDNYL